MIPQVSGFGPVTDGLALVFDLDGVIVDSMPTHIAAWRAYLESLGISPEALETRMHGRRNDEIVREIIGSQLSASEIFDHGAAKEALFRKMIHPDLTRTLIVGVSSFIENCRGAPIALATNAEPANVDFVLDGAGLRPYFQVIVDGHQVDRPKPFPDIYVRAAELLGVAPKNCIVFEDSPAGIAAAQAAGCRVVGVLSHSDALPAVDLKIRDFSDSSLEQWLRAVEPQA